MMLPSGFYIMLLKWVLFSLAAMWQLILCSCVVYYINMLVKVLYWTAIDLRDGPRQVAAQQQELVGRWHTLHRASVWWVIQDNVIILIMFAWLYMYVNLMIEFKKLMKQFAINLGLKWLVSTRCIHTYIRMCTLITP